MLKKLSLEKCKIHDDGAVAISESLKVNKSLEDLNLNNCGIGARGGKAIGEALQLGTAVLTVTDLRFNNLDTESATLLATIAKEKGVSLCGIKPDQTEANLQGKPGLRMGPLDAILLTADLAVRAVLTNLNLADNNLCGNKFGGKYDASGIQALSDALASGRAEIPPLTSRRTT